MDRIASATKWQTPSFGFTKLQIMSGGLHGHFVSTDIRYVHGYFCVYGHLFGSTATDLFMCLRTLLCLRTLRVYGHIVSTGTVTQTHTANTDTDTTHTHTDDTWTYTHKIHADKGSMSVEIYIETNY